MGRLTDRMPVAEQTMEDPARAPKPAGPDPVPDESPEDALTRLQSTVGNGAMPGVVGGAAASDAGPAPVPAPDAAAPPTPDAGTPAPAPDAEAPPTPGAPTPATPAGAGPVPDATPVIEDEEPPAPDTGAEDLDTSMLELVDEELVEHGGGVRNRPGAAAGRGRAAVRGGRGCGRAVRGRRRRCRCRGRVGCRAAIGCRGRVGWGRAHHAGHRGVADRAL